MPGEPANNWIYRVIVGDEVGFRVGAAVGEVGTRVGAAEGTGVGVGAVKHKRKDNKIKKEEGWKR
jgi:hypothetical protein